MMKLGFLVRLVGIGGAGFLVACSSPSSQAPQSAAMTQAEPTAMAQAPSSQAVHTPLPPPTATPVPSSQAQPSPPAASTPPTASPVPISTPTTGPYVRLDVGHSVARQANFKDDHAVSPTCFIAVNYPGVCGASLNHLGSSTALGIGVGYRFGNGWRGDITYGHREGYNLRGRDPEGTDFDPPVSSKSMVASLYYDFPIMLGMVQPFAGGGFGRSRNTMNTLQWRDPTSSGRLPGGKNNAFAWQFSAGANFVVSRDLIIELGYRYMDMGKFKKSAGADLEGQFNPPPNGTGSATGRLRADELYLSVRREF